MRIKWKFDVPFRPPVYAVGEDGSVAEDDGNPFTTRSSYWKGIVWLLIALGAQSAASLMSEEVESYYSQFLFYYTVRTLSMVNKYLKSVSFGEIFFTLLVVWFISWSVWYLRRSYRRETKFYNVLKVFFLQILWLGSLLVPIFLAFWGLNYQRTPLADTLGYERIPTHVGDLGTIGLQIVNGVNSSYDLARGSSERPNPPSRETLYNLIEKGFQNEGLIGEAAKGVFSDPKPLALSRLASWGGVTGFYIPFTGEVTYNPDIPPVELPMVIAHHKAHQRGYAREDEASFIGYMVCIHSSDPYIRYSGYVYGLKVLDTLQKGNVDRFSDIADGPRADLAARAQFWERAQVPTLAAVSRRIFSAYLGANRVSGGVKNMEEDVPLIISYYLKNAQREPSSAAGGADSFDGDGVDQMPSADAVPSTESTAPPATAKPPSTL
ncbi:MAG TPA: DUF3810 domain-containing protein [Blastocatellia bacterium]|nr:DUF3810 domain-containing protein [Blastocatellia bacterium]